MINVTSEALTTVKQFLVPRAHRMMQRHLVLAFVVSGAFLGAHVGYAQSTGELFVQPRFDTRFSPDVLPQLPYGAALDGSIQALEGSGFTIGVPQGGNTIVIDVDPLANTIAARALRDLAVGDFTGRTNNLSSTVLGAYELQSSLTLEDPNPFPVQEFGKSELDLPPTQLTRYNELSSRFLQLTLEEFHELQELYRKGVGNPDPGTPTPYTPFAPQPFPVIAGTSICLKATLNADVCKYIGPSSPNYSEFCTCE